MTQIRVFKLTGVLKKYVFWGGWVTSVILLTGCEKKKLNSADVPYQDKYANAISHYSSSKDSLKLKSLYFILNNLKDQYFLKGDWKNAYDNAIIKGKSNSLKNLLDKQDSVNQIYPFSFDTVRDVNVINDAYLIRNIDRAFESRKYKWAGDLSFKDFCEYVLPYKLGNEKPELWGSCLKDEAYLSNDSLTNVKNIFEATAYVNNRLSWYKGTIDYDYPLDLGYDMSRLIATGTCKTMTRVAAFEMRALGLPVVIDFTPAWGNRSEGHHWNALVYKNKSYPFDANGPNIGLYKIEFKGTGRIPYKISKVFRQTFSIQKNSLGALAGESEAIPAMFNTKRVKDVTSQYVPVSDVTLSYSKRFSNKFAYLCTFDNKDWVLSSWGQITGHSIDFRNIGRDVVYLPELYVNINGSFKLMPIGNPFVLFANGQSKEIKANIHAKQTMVITKKYPEDETNNTFKGNEYELFYWDGKWRSMGVQVAKSNKLYYYNVPSDALYWIRNLTVGKQERIFTYENNQQVWW